MISTEFAEIFELFPNIKQLYLGAYSADTLPSQIKTSHFIVANTDLSSNVGKHWYIIYRYSSSILEVFDSLGIDSDKKNFLESNLKLSGVKKVIYNTTQFQTNQSDTCGKFVIYFIINRLFNLDHSFKNLLEEIFSPNQDQNEFNVRTFYNEILNSEKS